MKKFLFSLILVALCLTGCQSSPSRNNDDSPKTTPSVDKEAEEAPSETVPTKISFQKNTNEELAGFPDPENHGASIGNALRQIGASDIVTVELGNYEAGSDDYFVDAKCTVDTDTELIVSAIYLPFFSDPEWSVISIRDYDTGNYYFVLDKQVAYVDLYDYKTGNLISKHIKDYEDTEVADVFEDFKNNVEEINDEFENSLDDLREAYKSGVASTPSKSYSLKYGTLVEANPNGGADGNTLVIKAKITSSATNNLTIKQNYFNVADIIHNQGGNDFNCIDYWAVADMTTGREEKVVAFTVSKDVIDIIYSNQIADNQLGDYADDLYIHPSLQ